MTMLGHDDQRAGAGDEERAPLIPPQVSGFRHGSRCQDLVCELLDFKSLVTQCPGTAMRCSPCAHVRCLEHRKPVVFSDGAVILHEVEPVAWANPRQMWRARAWQCK